MKYTFGNVGKTMITNEIFTGKNIFVLFFFVCMLRLVHQTMGIYSVLK